VIALIGVDVLFWLVNRFTPVAGSIMVKSEEPCTKNVKERTMLGTILVVFLILALFGALPRWSHSRDWGYVPTGGVGLALLIVVILVVLGRL
jgi:hypothetical protein